MSSNGEPSPSFRPPTRNTPIGLSLAVNASPSLRPPSSTRLRTNLLPHLSIKTTPSTASTTSTNSSRLILPLTPPTPDEDSSPSPVAVKSEDFGRQVRRCIGDEEPENALAGGMERLNLSTSADGDDEATPPAQDSAFDEIADLDEEGWRRAARTGGIKEISILGEGSSGSVSRCRLRNGTQEFALKVRYLPVFAIDSRLFLRIPKCKDRF